MKEYKNRCVVVSGASGFIGSLLIKKLYDHGYEVVSIIANDDNSNLDIVKKCSSIIIRTNFVDDSFKTQLPIHALAFIHLAWTGVNGVLKGDEITQNNNVDMALNAASAAVYSKIKKFIGLGTITELSYLNRTGQSLSPSLIYGKYKNICFERLQQFFNEKETNFFWLRLSNLYGSSNKTGNILNYEIEALLNGKKAIFGKCDQYYDFLLVDDAIEAIFRFVEKEINSDCNDFFIGTGEPRILLSYLTYIAKVIDGAEIIIGSREDDGMVFKKAFFDTTLTKALIGDYVSYSFEENINKLINELKTNV